MKTRALLGLVLLLAGCSSPEKKAEAPSLLPAGWDPKAAGDKVMAGLFRVTAPEVRGAHDSHFAIVGDRAYEIGRAHV